MPTNDEIVRQRQCDIRREIDRRAIALKAVSFDSGIPYETLLTYFPNPEGARKPAMIPASAVYAILAGKALPGDLMSVLLPAGWQLIQVPEEVDHDEIERAARDYLSEKGLAHRTDSPAGRDIAACEDNRLRVKATRLRAVAA